MKQRLVKSYETFSASSGSHAFLNGLVVGIGEVCRVGDVIETHDCKRLSSMEVMSNRSSASKVKNRQ
jgi:hypothetical protein